MSDPDRPTVTNCIRAWQVLRTAHDRVAQRLAAELARECALALNEFDVLLYLRSHAHEEVRIGVLLKVVSLSQSALSRLVARLEERGLLARSGAEADGRAIVVCLTTNGAALIDRAIDIHARTVHDALTSAFGDTEHATLLQTLSQIGR